MMAVRNKPDQPQALTVGVLDLLDDGTDAKFREFVADLFAATSAMQSIRRTLGKATGLTGSEIAMLLAIRRLAETGPVSVRAIAEHLHVTAPHATTEIGKLVEAGLARKSVDARDSRAVDVQLTAEGREKLQHLTPRVRAVNDVLFAGMTGKEMAQAHRFLRRLVTQSTEALRELDGA
jgi:MarR family transcriptional regulator, organic hydroperoxide resistance regulator